MALKSILPSAEGAGATTNPNRSNTMRHHEKLQAELDEAKAQERLLDEARQALHTAARIAAAKVRRAQQALDEDRERCYAEAFAPADLDLALVQAHQDRMSER